MAQVLADSVRDCLLYFVRKVGTRTNRNKLYGMVWKLAIVLSVDVVLIVLGVSLARSLALTLFLFHFFLKYEYKNHTFTYYYYTYKTVDSFLFFLSPKHPCI